MRAAVQTQHPRGCEVVSTLLMKRASASLSSNMLVPIRMPRLKRARFAWRGFARGRYRWRRNWDRGRNPHGRRPPSEKRRPMLPKRHRAPSLGRRELRAQPPLRADHQHEALGAPCGCGGRRRARSLAWPGECVGASGEDEPCRPEATEQALKRQRPGWHVAAIGQASAYMLRIAHHVDDMGDSRKILQRAFLPIQKMPDRPPRSRRHDSSQALNMQTTMNRLAVAAMITSRASGAVPVLNAR